MSKPTNRFLAALEAARRGKTFVCPTTSMEVTLSVPSVLDLRVARMMVTERWKKDDLTQATAGQYLDDYATELLIRVAKHDGVLLGRECIEALEEPTFEVYSDALEDLRRDAGEAMTDDELAAALDELKKKHETLGDTLSGFESIMLRTLLAYTVNLLLTSQT